MANKEQVTRLNRGIIKICSGILESVTTEPYISAVEQAEQVIGKSYAPDAEKERQKLVEAIKLNLVNRKEYPINMLIRHYDLSISERQFKREKYQFCEEIARRLNL